MDYWVIVFLAPLVYLLAQTEQHTRELSIQASLAITRLHYFVALVIDIKAADTLYATVSNLYATDMMLCVCTGFRCCFVLLCSEPHFVLSLQSEGARLQREMKAYIAAVKGDSS